MIINSLVRLGNIIFTPSIYSLGQNPDMTAMST